MKLTIVGNGKDLKTNLVMVCFGITERIHRVLYAFFVKPIPRETKTTRKWSIDHLCRNHKCCNPEHLELVSQQENGLRGEGLQAINAKKKFCKFGHPLPSYNPKIKRYCKTCDSIRHKKRMQGPNRKYWLRKQNEAVKRYYHRKKLINDPNTPTPHQ